MAHWKLKPATVCKRKARKQARLSVESKEKRKGLSICPDGVMRRKV